MARSGQKLETQLEKYHRHLEDEGHALVFKVPTPHQVLDGHNGRFTSAKLDPVFVDFSGLIAGGRAVAIEAKVRGKGNLCHSHLTEDQAKRLRQVGELGGVAAIFARLRKGGLVDLVVPYAVLAAESSVRPDDERWKTPPMTGWLSAALEWDRYKVGGWPELGFRQTGEV